MREATDFEIVANAVAERLRRDYAAPSGPLPESFIEALRALDAPVPAEDGSTET